MKAYKGLGALGFVSCGTKSGPARRVWCGVWSDARIRTTVLSCSSSSFLAANSEILGIPLALFSLIKNLYSIQPPSITCWCVPPLSKTVRFSFCHVQLLPWWASSPPFISAFAVQRGRVVLVDRDGSEFSATHEKGASISFAPFCLSKLKWVKFVLWLPENQIQHLSPHQGWIYTPSVPFPMFSPLKWRRSDL